MYSDIYFCLFLCYISNKFIYGFVVVGEWYVYLWFLCFFIIDIINYINVINN